MPGSVSLSDRQPPSGHGKDAAASPAAPAPMSGAASALLPAGMSAASAAAFPIRNMKMKFAVLSGLIQAGEVSNRDIVETVLNLVSGAFL